ncbi:MAG: nuclear transport factor 2 family protein [Thermoanaerobaculia bacterium]|nr:nuclear transport factor 2 family protein [Thermoanaerobaculia bacterium]
MRIAATASLIVCTLGLCADPAAAADLTPLEAVEAYAAAWAEPDEGKRRALLEKGWAENGVYADPTAYVEGREALVSHIAGFLSQMGTARLERSSGVDVHHGMIRFAWRIVAADGSTVVAEGFDYGELDDDGRLRKIVGFFGPFPQLESDP